VLWNLCINARDAMLEGGMLTIATSSAELCEQDVANFPGAQPGSYALITVADTGRGMFAEEQAKIFEPYFTTKDAEKGTGLGLAIVYNVVKKLRGIIRCESRPGHGSKFSIWLPVASQSEYTRRVTKAFTNDVLLDAVKDAVVSRGSLISV
jgi:signal transduction histidine kinase